MEILVTVLVLAVIIGLPAYLHVRDHNKALAANPLGPYWIRAAKYWNEASRTDRLAMLNSVGFRPNLEVAKILGLSPEQYIERILGYEWKQLPDEASVELIKSQMVAEMQLPSHMSSK